MFELIQSSYGKYRRYMLHHPETGDGFSIVPECGAAVLEIHFRGNAVLDGYRSPEELEAGKWAKSAILFPFPNRLKDGQYSWMGRDYAFPLNHPASHNAIHGFVRDERFEVVHIELTPESAEITCRLDYRGQHAWYPFPFMLEATFGITNRNEFNISFFLKNRHHEPIPVALGWHPYFRLAETADEHQMQLPPCAQIEVDTRMLPTGRTLPFSDFTAAAPIGKREIDNCFQAQEDHPLYHLTLHGKGHTLAVAASRNLFPFFQVFIPPSRESIALEPMTCNVNAFQSGDHLETVPATGDWTAAFRLEYYQ